MADQPQGGPPPPPPVAVGRALLKGVRPGDRVCSLSGLAVYQGRRKNEHMAIIALEGRGPEHTERFVRVARYGGLTGLRIEHVDESLVLAMPLPSGTLADLPALGWRLNRRLETFAAIAKLFNNVHGAGQFVGPLPPEHVFLDDELTPFFLGPGLAEQREFKGVFAAPESAKDGTIDARSDVFVLGRLLHFLLLQKMPSVENSVTPKLDDLLQLPAGLSRIVRKCVTIDRIRRYESVDAMLRDFSRYAEHEIVGMAHPEAREVNFGRESKPPLRSPVPGARGNQTNPKLSASNPRIGHTTNPRMSQSGARGGPGVAKTTPIPRGPESRILRLGVASRIACAIVGVVAAGAAVGISVFSAYSPVSLGMLCVGAGLIGLAIPPSEIRKEGIIRVAASIALVIPAVLWNPLPQAAFYGAESRVASGNLDIRARAFTQLVSAGRKNFFGLDLTGADLKAVKFMSCDLSQVSLERALLNDASFWGTTLAGTKFTGAYLQGTSFEGTDADAAIGFDQALCDETTHLPKGWICFRTHPLRFALPNEIPPAGAPAPEGAPSGGPGGAAPVPGGAAVPSAVPPTPEQPPSGAAPAAGSDATPAAPVNPTGAAVLPAVAPAPAPAANAPPAALPAAPPGAATGAEPPTVLPPTPQPSPGATVDPAVAPTPSAAPRPKPKPKPVAPKAPPAAAPPATDNPYQ